ncbi:MAG TPA: hypothetical protein PKK31_06070 [Elusimicrobiales bacterium]|nr:hypothetical protein [Elusimicrobiales bacterium]
MASKFELILAIENRVKGSKTVDYSLWTVGVTEDEARRRTEHGNPEYWRAWPADSDSIARDVEQHFLDRGMKGGPGGPGNSKFVYIF